MALLPMQKHVPITVNAGARVESVEISAQSSGNLLISPSYSSALSNVNTITSVQFMLTSHKLRFYYKDGTAYSVALTLES